MTEPVSMTCAGRSYLDEQINLFFSFFQRNDSALDRNGYSMSAVVGSKFGKDRLHMAFDRVFRDRKVRRDIFIRIARRDLLQHFQLAFAKSVRRMMFRHSYGNLRRNSPPAGVHAANRVQEILSQGALEQVSPGSRVEGLSCLDITFIRR